LIFMERLQVFCGKLHKVVNYSECVGMHVRNLNFKNF
jgi:hypothetical protein